MREQCEVVEALCRGGTCVAAARMSATSTATPRATVRFGAPVARANRGSELFEVGANIHASCCREPPRRGRRVDALPKVVARLSPKGSTKIVAATESTEDRSHSLPEWRTSQSRSTSCSRRSRTDCARRNRRTRRSRAARTEIAIGEGSSTEDHERCKHVEIGLTIRPTPLARFAELWNPDRRRAHTDRRDSAPSAACRVAR
jgi:hypothetical protein